MTARVLVLDGNQRGALAVTRSLGRRGLEVVTAESTTRCLAGCSRYASARVIYPSPADDPAGFLAAVEALVSRHNFAVVLPITDTTTTLLVRHPEAVGDARLPFPPLDDFDLLTNKQRLVKLAEALGIAVPVTHSIMDAAARFDIYPALRFPVAVKPAYSKVEMNGSWLSVGVQYADSVDELEEIIINNPCLGTVPLLVQQRITGQGHGVFALYDHGRPVAFFSHRRLRERPPSGGVSVLSESVPPHEASRDVAHALLSAARWHGVAMVEFKMDASGVPYLMEVNGRFWGSLQLAVDAGVDFPFLLYQVAMGEHPSVSSDYRAGCRSRWLLGDLDHLYFILKKDRRRYSLGQKVCALREFLRLFDGARHEVNRVGDLRPFFHELRTYFRPQA